MTVKLSEYLSIPSKNAEHYTIILKILISLMVGTYSLDLGTLTIICDKMLEFAYRRA